MVSLGYSTGKKWDRGSLIQVGGVSTEKSSQTENRKESSWVIERILKNLKAYPSDSSINKATSANPSQRITN